MDNLIQTSFISEVNYFRVLLGIIILLFLNFLIVYTFRKTSNSSTNRVAFSLNLPLFSLAIFLIVLTIKSSLALSLGMIGALSIIRFRTAIKEPEQIIQFLIITAIGIGIGAEKEILTIIITVVFIIVSFLVKPRIKENSFNFLRIEFENSQSKIELDALLNLDDSLVLSSLYSTNDGSTIVEYKCLEKIKLKKIEESLDNYRIKDRTINLIA
ncbi:DUF4956 domain-containing protein [bacterium]|nr:DUF4956 domain-containing protein [bacterium]